MQPIEAIRVLIVLFLAGYFTRRWELLREVRSETVRGRTMPRWVNVPRLEYVLPVLAGVVLALALFFLQRDLGPALVISLVFLAMYALARGALVMAAVGLALLVAGFYAGHVLGISATLADRVRMWQAPWDNAARGGDQIAQALWSFATGIHLGHRPRPRGHEIPAGRPHRSGTRRGWRGTRLRRHRCHRAGLCGHGLAWADDRTACIHRLRSVPGRWR